MRLPETPSLLCGDRLASETLAVLLRYPDGSEVEHPDGVTGLEVAKSIGPRLAEAAVAVKLNGQLLDLDRPLTEGGDFAVITLKDPEGLHILRHSSAHVLAQAVLAEFPGSTFAIGPPIEDGFYYDFARNEPFHPEDLERIEARMAEIIAADKPFRREVVSREEARRRFEQLGEYYKLELLDDIP
ncbi:MAG TPA: TGS domain-containing protein, partial [Acidimicrobiia bacterium]|nr:TGS domain-containing protein [Acidimicrobiia bacterium]